jgi:hypothetical protein
VTEDWFFVMKSEYMFSHFGGSARAVGRRGEVVEVVMGLRASMGGGLVEEFIAFGGEEMMVVASWDVK